MNYKINDNYVKIRLINNIWHAVHLYNESILYSDKTKVFSDSLSNYTIERIKKTIQEYKRIKF